MNSSHNSQSVQAFQQKILTWYKEHQRDLPWRKDRDPYHILVSEIMLQQTQVRRVVPKYEAWLARFPTVKELAEASIAEVLSYWNGLGYNRRALNLKKTAEIIIRDFGGRFPQDEKQLLALPGIGAYTARAVLCFAFDKQVAVVDTNVKKVILTQFHCHPDRPKEVEGSLINNAVERDSSTTFHSARNDISDKEVQEFADKLLPHGHAYEWNQALMDYAGAVLSKEKIFIPKQSKFIGSRRYYRGQILKLLIKKKTVTLQELSEILAKDKEWLEEVVGELTHEGFVRMQKDKVQLSH